MTPAKLELPGVRTTEGYLSGRPKVAPLSATPQLAEVLDSPEIAALVSELESTRWTGRPGYPIRAMVGMALAKSIYAIPTWTKTVALVREHVGLRLTITNWGDDVPSVYACYGFTAKLRAHADMLTRCIDGVIAGLHDAKPDLGTNVAIDGSDMSAYANGQRFLYDVAPSALATRTPMRRGAPLRRLHALAWRVLRLQARHGSGHRHRSSLAWNVRTAGDNESLHALDVLDAARARGFKTETCAMDKGYDLATIYDGCEARDCRPIITLRQTPDVKAGKDKPPTCDHGQ